MSSIAGKGTAATNSDAAGVPLSVVGIAASPACLGSVTELLAALPPDGGAAFVVLQDARSGKKGVAASALARASRIDVVEAKEGERLCANRAYVVPPGRQASLEHGVLRITAREAVRPIDHFFRSLAEDQEERAIGVVLPRAGDDGLLGLEHVVAHGGLVLAQADGRGNGEPAPGSANDVGLVTHALPVRDMPAAILRRACHPGGDGWDAAGMRALGEILQRRFGVPFEAYRQSMILRRVERRMALRHVAQPRDYLALLENDAGETNALFKDLLIGLTGFFRDAEAWQALEVDAIRPLVGVKGADEPIRAWVVGTGTGEEAYSLAMAIADERARAGRPGPIQVFATDANADALEVARAGVYGMDIAAQVPRERLAHYFTQAHDHGAYRVQRALRESVIFGTHNVITDAPLSRVDLVSCRNLLIYLEPEAQRRVVEALHFALNPGGYLFLGGGEIPPQKPPMFETLSRRWRIYRRLGGPPRERAAASAPLPSAATAVALAQAMILERFAPASVLVDERGQVLYFAGGTERYLRPLRGTPTRELAALVRDGLRAELQDALHRSAARGRTAMAHGALIQHPRAILPVKITVIPVVPGAVAGERKLFLAVFQDQTERSAPAAGRAGQALLRRLEEDLRGTREELQTTVERLERSNEDLRASEAELMSANEELRAANDELVRWKQEMQSLIDGLQTANDDLHNLLASSDLASVCLDAELRIKWFSPAARSVLNIISSDTGRPISDLASPLAGDLLVADAQEVLRASGVIERELHSGARWYLRRTMPYRTRLGAVQGVIVNFTDVTEAQRAADAALAARAHMTQSLEERVAAASIQVRTLAAQLALVEQREREAIASDLHDNLAQLLHVAKLKLAAFAESPVEAARRGMLEELRLLLDQAEASVRSLVFQIHPPLLSQLGLVPALQWLAEDLHRSHGLAVEVSDDGAAKLLEPATRAVAYRTVRELLINVAKHAGVHSARVELKPSGGVLAITVRDRGRGFAPPAAGDQGFGLLSLRERLSYIGGDLQIISMPDHGTEATLTVPLAGAPAAGPQQAQP